MNDLILKSKNIKKIMVENSKNTIYFQKRCSINYTLYVLTLCKRSTYLLVFTEIMSVSC